MYCTISYWTNILRTWHQTRRHTSKHSVNPFNKQLKITRTWCHQSLQHYGWLVRQNPQNSNPPPAHQMYHGHPPPVSKQILFCLESIADIPIVDLSADWDSGSSPQSESLFGSSTPPNSLGIDILSHPGPQESWIDEWAAPETTVSGGQSSALWTLPDGRDLSFACGGTC